MQSSLFAQQSLARISDDKFFITRCFFPKTSKGILDGLSFAVKDVIDIADYKTSCGNPIWYNKQPKAEKHAICVEQLLEAGASCVGKTILGEFCSGSTGINHFYGMPPNPRYPKHVPGGSSSGSAAAVAAELVDFALGTDSAGSVRLPATFCGVLGLRPSYGLISMEGVKSFSPSFDTVGIFARTIDVLEKAFISLTGFKNSLEGIAVKNFYVLEDYLTLVPDEHKKIFLEFIAATCDSLKLKPKFIRLKDIHPDADKKDIGLSTTFKKLFCQEIWQNIGHWLQQEKLTFGKQTYVDFSFMESLKDYNLGKEIEQRKMFTAALNKLVTSGDVLCIPTAPNVPPLRNQDFKQVNSFDYDKLRPLVALASMAGLPQITVPITEIEACSLGISLIGGAREDLFLINTARRILTKQILQFKTASSHKNHPTEYYKKGSTKYNGIRL